MTTFQSLSGKKAWCPALAGVVVLAAVVSAQTATDAFDSNRAWEHVRQQVAIGPRPSGSPANVRTRAYITAQLKSIGITAVEQAFEGVTPLGNVRMVNIIGTIPGKSPDRIILGSHFDTKLYRDVRFVGASDGASSTAALIELGRVLKARKELPFTIELLFLDGEEAVLEWSAIDSTYGSRHYVDAARKSGSLKSIRAFILLDMIGDRSLTIRRDPNSTRWLTDIIWATAAKLGHRQFMSEEMAIEDDHLPFLKAGVPAVDIIDLDYAEWHTPKDTLDAISARSLQIVGDVVVAALPQIEARLAKP